MARRVKSSAADIRPGPDYARTNLYNLSASLRTPLTPLIVLDTNLLLPEVRRFAEGKNSVMVELLQNQVFRFVTPRHVVHEFLEPEKLTEFARGSVTEDDLRRTFETSFAPHLFVPDLPDEWEVNGLRIADGDDQPLANLIEILEPDAVFSKDYKHLSGLNIQNDTANVLLALNWGLNRTCLVTVGRNSSLLTLAVLDQSWRALLQALGPTLERVPAWIWAVIGAAAAFAVMHPSSRARLVEGGRAAYDWFEPFLSEFQRVGQNASIEFGKVHSNAELARPIVEAARPVILESKTEVGAAVLVLARAREPLNIAQIRVLIGEHGLRHLQNTVRRLAAALADHPLVERIAPGQWQLRGRYASSLIEQHN